MGGHYCRLKLDELLPRRVEFGGLVTNLETEARDAGATIVLNRCGDRARIESEAPDAVILATGATALRPEIKPVRSSLRWAVLFGPSNTRRGLLRISARLSKIAQLGFRFLDAGTASRTSCHSGGPGRFGDKLQAYIF